MPEKQQHICADSKGTETIIVCHCLKSERSLEEALGTTDV